MHVADDLIQQGRLARFEGRAAQALGHYQSAAALFKEQQEDARWAQTMRYVATIEVELKRGEDARRDIEAVLAIYTKTPPDMLELANATRVAALAAEACGEAERGKALWKDAAELFAEARLMDGRIEANREAAMHAHLTHAAEEVS